MKVFGAARRDLASEAARRAREMRNSIARVHARRGATLRLRDAILIRLRTCVPLGVRVRIFSVRGSYIRAENPSCDMCECALASARAQTQLARRFIASPAGSLP